MTRMRENAFPRGDLPTPDRLLAARVDIIIWQGNPTGIKVGT
jgi:hypothetical protein